MGRGAARIVVNLAVHAVDVPVAAPRRAVTVRAAWASGTQVGPVKAGAMTVRMPARSVTVLA